MIKLVFDLDKNILDSLSDCHYARRVKSNFVSYGAKYDFCRFYLHISDKTQKPLSVISQFNATMIIAPLKGNDCKKDETSELLTLVKMNSPQTIELPLTFAEVLKDKLSNFTPCMRTEFEYISKNHSPLMEVDETPRLQDVYDILKTSFPAIADGYELWLTDTSHKVRRGLSQCFVLGGCTTATIQYICDGVALVGQVATKPEERGKFHARKLLYWIGERLYKRGFTVRLFARSNRVSYYEEIGFKELQSDIVFERKDSFE